MSMTDQDHGAPTRLSRKAYPRFSSLGAVLGILFSSIAFPTHAQPPSRLPSQQPLQAQSPAQADAQTTIYRGGPIITMDGDQPQLAEVVIVRDGKILYTGSAAQAPKIKKKDQRIHDLAGNTLLPGFIDAHSHFSAAIHTSRGLDLWNKNLPTINTIADLQNAIRAHLANASSLAPSPANGWQMVWQYDPETLAEKRHITRAELDAISPHHPLVVMHVSLHGAVANSAALAAAGITDASTAPAGGIIGRDADGKLNGLLLETAMFALLAKSPKASEADNLAGLEAAQNRYFAEGYTHAQDGATQPADLAFLTSEAARARIKIDLALLPFASQLDGLFTRDDLKFGEYQGHIKLQGIKFVLDGSPQARTAFFTQDYARGSPEGHHPWHGAPVTSAADFTAAAKKVMDRGWQLFVHANGDAAIDMAIAGFDQLGVRAADNRRPIIIHSQFQRKDQLPAYVRLGVGPSYFSNHTYYWADIHRSNFPAETVDFISPLKSAAALGLHTSNHSDYSVTPLDTRFMLWSSMARRSISGVVSGPDEQLGAYQALQALTTGPAWQIFEEDRKGRIKAGLLADFVILDRNPLDTPTDDIKSIKVLETIKEGRSIWRTDAP